MPYVHSKNEQCDEPGHWLTETYNRLDKCGLSINEVSQATGLPFAWLTAFRGKVMKGPSVNRIEILYRFLVSNDN